LREARKDGSVEAVLRFAAPQEKEAEEESRPPRSRMAE